jgi:hypothetical protein
VRPTKVYIPTQPMRVTSEAVKHLSSLSQFHGIRDESLILLAHRRTGLHVPSRWVAISLLRSNLGPIPVPDLKECPKRQVTGTKGPAKLIAIKGGRTYRLMGKKSRV